MKKKKLKVQVAALAMTGAIAAAPLTVRAEEASTTAPATASTSSTEASATAAAPAVSTATTPAVSGTTGGASTATASTPATGTEATAGTSTATATTGAGNGTAATATTEASAPTAAATPVTVVEAPADPATTVPNNVDTVVPDDNKQGTDIKANASAKFGFFTLPLADINASISAEDAKGDKTIAESNPSLGNNSITALKNKDVVMQGDLSIAKEDGSEAYDSTATAAHDVNKEDSYSLKADLDVTAVNNAINASADFIPNSNDISVNNMETGLRATFTFGNDLDGSFHTPTDLEDAKKHYELSSADGSPMIYRINYANSNFAKDKVSIAMDLDLTKMTPLVNRYSSAGANYKNLYGTDPVTGKENHIENYNYPASEYRTRYQTSVFGNLKELINNSAKKIQLVMKGVKLNSASSNRVETETENEKTTTTEGTVHGTLVGYMKADMGMKRVKGKASYVWGAIQNDAGRDSVTGQNNDKVNLTVKFSTTEKKEKPVDPVQPENPAQPVTPVAPSNGGGSTPSLAPARPSSSTPSNPGTVLGESRPTASTPSGEVLGENRETPVADTVEKKQGAVLGESRPSVKGVSDRASVATGDYNFTGLWASLFGISLAALAGFVVLQKKKEN
ncbi:cell surface protein [Oribacterium sinus]|uniref:cell surface protein n=1 Tax=Oribacterium sinus TaxID=237576 RepID=UPI0028EA3B79|nr:cell surface protein [Oribacterium sinus]